MCVLLLHCLLFRCMKDDENWNVDSYHAITTDPQIVIDIGLEAEKLIASINQASQAFIMVFYTTSLVAMTLLAFELASNLGLNEVPTEQNKAIWTSVYVLATLMYLIRLYTLTKSGQILANAIKESKTTFEDVIIQSQFSKLGEDAQHKASMLRNRLEVYLNMSPINPYSIFAMNYRTFCATLATIITYMVVLVRFRVVKASQYISVQENGTLIN